jgi:exosortase
MLDKPTKASEGYRRNASGFALYTAVCVAVFWIPLRDLVRLSLSTDTYSHIVVIPFLSLFLIYLNRKQVFEGSRRGDTRIFAGLLLLGAVLYGVGRGFRASFSENALLEFAILDLLCFIWAGFILFYGRRTFHLALFPLLFLVLTVPLPQMFLDRLILWLQWGSAEVTSWMFYLTGTPVLRDGLRFTVPGVTIEIAKECSGIRSTLALLITCLVAGYLVLRTAWARFALLVVALPVLILKNGIRIAVLTLLAIHVDPGFLFGRLHHEGGFLFFGLGLLILLPVLTWLHRNEHGSSHPETTGRGEVRATTITE